MLGITEVVAFCAEPSKADDQLPGLLQLNRGKSDGEETLEMNQKEHQQVQRRLFWLKI